MVTLEVTLHLLVPYILAVLAKEQNIKQLVYDSIEGIVSYLSLDGFCYLFSNLCARTL